MDKLLEQIITAIQAVKVHIQWKPGSAPRHLLKRKLRGHLPTEATLADYERIIRLVLNETEASVYAYHHRDAVYVALVAVVQAQHWLVMFTLEGVLESAFVIERPTII